MDFLKDIEEYGEDALAQATLHEWKLAPYGL